MNGDYINISVAEIGLAALLILANGLISIFLKLRLEKQLLIASVRMVVQLFAIGLILKWVFAADKWYIVVAIMTVMTVIAGLAARNRSRIRYQGMQFDALFSIWIPSWMIMGVGLVLILRIEPWYSPQYVIPVLGMIMGNTLTGVSLGLDRITNELTQRRDHVEMMLSLGATGWEAYREAAQNAVRAGMMPTINSMMVIGLVSLPGMMTGQILAGQDPEQAIRYQILLMFLLTASSGIACMLAVLLVFRRVFSAQNNFQYWKLHEPA